MGSTRKLYTSCMHALCTSQILGRILRYSCTYVVTIEEANMLSCRLTHHQQISRAKKVMCTKNCHTHTGTRHTDADRCRHQKINGYLSGGHRRTTIQVTTQEAIFNPNSERPVFTDRYIFVPNFMKRLEMRNTLTTRLVYEMWCCWNEVILSNFITSYIKRYHIVSPRCH